MSKVSFRARQIDFNRPLPILKNDSDLLSEFNENTLVSRGVPQIPSGMEKEEENEHHFVEVIHALQLKDDSDVKIPVPDIIDRSHFYQQTYPDLFSLPKHLVHIRTSLFAENDDPEYDMDSEDEEWLSKSRLGIAPDKFESMIDRLERGCGQRVMNLEEAKCLLQDDPSLAIAVYDYWLSKRVQSRQPLLYAVRQEKRDNASGCDPYIAFRRRSEKMQTRKNRKNDEQSYEKMLILRSQMEILGQILARLIRREATKSSIVECEQRSFETRFQLSDWDGSHLADAELLTRKPLKADDSLTNSEISKTTSKRSARKRKLTQRALDSSLPAQSSDISDTERSRADERFAFVRLPGCRYLKPRNVGNSEEHSKAQHPHLLYSLTTVPLACNPTQRTYTGYIRRRLGRGGRIVCDRLETPSNASCPSPHNNRRLTMQTIGNPSFGYAVPFQAPDGSMDEALIRRLRPVILGCHSAQPSLRWPICTKFSSAQFEPLKFSDAGSYHPMYIAEASSQKCEDSTHSPLSNPPVTSGFTCQPSLGEHQSSNRDLPNDRISSVPNHSDSKVSSTMASLDAVSSVENSSASAGKLSTRSKRFHDPVDGHKSIECPKPRCTDLSKACSNGLSPILSHSIDDRLLRKDASVLPTKLYRVSQNCVSMDSGISGPQLQATNGITSTQFCQLPT